MRPTFMAFQTAYRAISANQISLDTVGNNIANVNTEGYSRQRVDLSSISNGGYIQRYKPIYATAGAGVEATKVSQYRDSFLDSRYRMQTSENSEYAAVLDGLNDLENILDETMVDGLMNQINEELRKALSTLAEDPTSSDYGTVVRTAAQKVTQLLNTYSTQVDSVRNQQIYDLSEVSVKTDFNSKVQNIAELNRQINEELAHGNNPNELYDQRNLLLDELSGLANIRISVEPKQLSEYLTVETLNVSILDDHTGQSIDIIRDQDFNTLSTTTGDDGTLRVEINSSFGNKGMKDITSLLTGGSIGGALNVINGKGDYGSFSNGDNDFRGTLYYSNVLDTFAANFAKMFNDRNIEDPSTPVPKDLFSTNDGSTPIKAGNIKISDDWMKDPMYITASQTGDSLDNENILRMLADIEGGVKFYKEGDDTKEVMFEGTLHEYLVGMQSTLGLDVDLYTNYYKTSDNVMNSLFATRESVVGVNLEEEGTYLMTFQKSYNAAVRYFTTLDEAINQVINSMGLVGR